MQDMRAFLLIEVVLDVADRVVVRHGRRVRRGLEWVPAHVRGYQVHAAFFKAPVPLNLYVSLRFLISGMDLPWAELRAEKLSSASSQWWRDWQGSAHHQGCCAETCPCWAVGTKRRRLVQLGVSNRIAVRDERAVLGSSRSCLACSSPRFRSREMA